MLVAAGLKASRRRPAQRMGAVLAHSFACVVLLLLAQLAASQPTGLTVSGDVVATTVLAIDDLRKIAPKAIEDTRAAGAGERARRKYVGVLLRDVLNQVKLRESEPRGFRKSFVVAVARDGYKVVFSWAELYLTPIGDSVYVVYERDGAALLPAEGPIALVSLADTSPGPRHVKWLQGIDVRMLRD
jgi:hypothetical protein